MEKSMRHIFLAVCLAVSTVCSAQVLLYDTFADGSRGQTNLPNESAVWASGASAVTMGSGSLAYAQSTSSRRLWTYFAPNGSPVSLGVGEQLVATIEFTPRGGLYDVNNKNFRFGLFYDPTSSQILADGATDSGGSGNPWEDSTGYAVQFPLSSGLTTSASASVGKRIAGLNTSLLGSNNAYPGQTSGGSPVVAAVDTLYTLMLVLDRVAADQMQVTYAIANAAGVIATHSILDDGTFGGNAVPIYTQFDQLAFRFSSASGTADVLDFHSIRIDYIPEPATMALLGLGGLLALKRWS
jgi:hypothetical protein